ncbi:3-dehydroquinate synthase family protein [Indiicoccus explosivorum]|uniref:3-dehydroquinate synthase family protein n=1 Tax=Indiicoccus explosivorum TaxID=1917864 RepID=UPI003B9857ED
MAEVIKHAFLSNPHWLDELLGTADITALTGSQLELHLSRGIAVKAAIVEEDALEQGARKFLNLGHTLAHAIEAHAGYGTVTHGEAVALGLAFDLLIGGHDRLEDYLKWCAANRYPLELLSDFDIRELLPYMKRDKKSSRGELVFIELADTGCPALRVLEEQEVISFYHKLGQKIKEVLG